MIQKICIYCASSDKVARKYFEGAEQVGKLMAQNDIAIVYGGGSVGLMGALADSALAHQGEVIGIIPRFMTEVEWDHKGLTHLVLVEDMHERKRRFLRDVDAVIALPGGCGTFEELLEVITLKRLGIFLKPILIFNQDGYYDPMIAMLEKAIAENFMGDRHRNIWSVVDRIEDILETIRQAPVWDESAINSARV